MSVHTLLKERLKFVLLVFVFSTFILFVLTLTNYRATYAIDSLAMRTSISEADVTFITEEAGDSDAGYTVTNAGDVNNDGIDDLLIGAYGSDYGGITDRGQVYLFFGKTTGWSSSIDLSTADASFIGELSEDYAGKNIIGPGDINGDNIDDIVIQSPYSDYGIYHNCGQVYIIFGKTSGWTMRQNLSTANASIHGLDSVFFGAGLSALGDVNNDGINDFGAGGSNLNTTGTLYLYFGKSTGWNMRVRFDLAANASIKGSGSTNSNFGNVTNGLGDVNGDNIDDFAIGWTSYPTNQGSFYVYFGKSSGWGVDQDGVAVSNAWYYSNVVDSIMPTSSISGGDVNGDSLNDIIVGAQNDDAGGTNAGKTYVIFGKSSGWAKNVAIQTSSNASFIGENATDLSGLYASGEGDINGDTLNDIFITAYGDDDGGANAGQVYVVYGKTSGWSLNQNLSTANASFVGNIASGNLGSFTSSASGDFNDDGANDILTGAAGVAGQERAYLIFGTPPTLNTPSLVSSTPLSPTSIRWNVTDNTTVEDGIRIYDESSVLKVECPGENLTYCDETGLSPNTAYIRKATAYNATEETAFSATNTGVTQANVPGTPLMGDGSNKVTIVPNSNPSHTEFVIFEPNRNKYVDKSTGALVDSASWGTYAEFGGDSGITLTGLSYSTGYDFQVKARNSNNVETSYSASAHLVSTPRPLGTFAMRTSISTADASFLTEAAGSYLGDYVTNVGDVNNDGYDDLAVGAYYSGYGGVTGRGQVYLFFGKASGWSIDKSASEADASFLGEGSGDLAGASIDKAGDINDDGIDDIIIGAQYNDVGGSDAGQAYIIFGKTSGWAMRQNLSTADASIRGIGSYRIGASVHGVGDVNNDGIDDIVIGATGAGSTGTAFLYFGKTSGWSMGLSYNTANASFVGSGSGSFFPSAVTRLGDVNGDTIDDLAIGWTADSTYGVNTGRVFILFGKTSGWALNQVTANVSDASYYSNVSGYTLPFDLSGGDINGDGLNDILISTQNDDTTASRAGKTHIIFGKTNGCANNQSIATANASIVGESASDYSSRTASAESDVNGDGIKDIVIGAYGDDDGGNSAGQIYIVYGKSSGWATNQNLSTANASFVGNIASGQLGYSLSAGGDFNNDGGEDILVGAPGGSANERAYLIFGSPPPFNAPSLGSGTAQSATTVRWNITDNTSMEDGIRIYDESNTLKVECVGENLTYCDETLAVT